MNYIIVRIYWGALRRYDWRLRDHVITTNRYRRIPFAKKSVFRWHIFTSGLVHGNELSNKVELQSQSVTDKRKPL